MEEPVGDPHLGLGLGLEGDEGREISAASLVQTLDKEEEGQRKAQRPNKMKKRERGRGEGTGMI